MAGRTWADDWAAWRIRAEAELRQATSNGTLPSIDRRYTSDDQGAAAAREEASILDGHGYEPTMRSEQGGEIKVANVLLLGALAACRDRHAQRARSLSPTASGRRRHPHLRESRQTSSESSRICIARAS